MSLTDSRVATSVMTSSVSPEQHEGVLVTGEHFYFRYRWGTAQLGVGPDIGSAVDDSRRTEKQIGDPFDGEFASAERRNAVFTELLDAALTTALLTKEPA